MQYRMTLFGLLSLGGILVPDPKAAIRSQDTDPVLYAGYDHALIVDGRSNLRVWGRNTYAQLGFGSTSPYQTTPVGNYLGDYCEIRQLTASGRADHTFAIKHTGELLAWGRNDYGQIGIGFTSPSIDIPTKIGNTGEWRIVATGRFHSLAIKPDGSLWAWGRNNMGQLGTNDKTNRSSPTPVSTNGAWISVAAGEDFSFALRADGTLYSWGNNADNRLGLNNTGIVTQLTPTPISGISEVVKMAGGWNSAIALTGNGGVYTWGGNSNGQLGRTVTTGSPAGKPGRVGSDVWKDIAIGGDFCLALRHDGDLFSWGKNSDGQLGDNSKTNRALPVGVYQTDKRYVSVVAGDKFVVAMKANGTVVSWGRNAEGQLGTGNLTQRSIPGVIYPLSFSGYTGARQGSVAAGGSHTMVIKTDGSLWGNGDNGFGQAGMPASTSFTRWPTPVSSDPRWISVAACQTHSLGIKSDGTLWGWGTNGSGELQGGPGADQYTPRQLTLKGDGWAQCAVEPSLSFCIKTNGELWLWGGGGSNFVQYRSDKRWVSVSVASGTYSGLTADGYLFVWGENSYGQVGDNSKTPRSAPVAIALTPGSTDRNWISVAAGNSSTNAVRADGTLYGWGRNAGGECGLGDVTTESLLPKRVTLQVGGTFVEKQWRSIGKPQMGQTAWSVTNTGDMYMWGYNSTGQFGFSPNDIPFGWEPIWLHTRVRSMSSNTSHTVQINNYGEVLAAGKNDKGQLGDGTLNTNFSFIYSQPVVQ